MTQLVELGENVNILPGLIVSIFLVVIHLSALLALIGNIKIPQTQKIIRFKEKRVRLKLADVPKTFEDWETHYAEYKEIVKNYKNNYAKLLEKEVQETEEDKAIEREITPYNIMVDVADVVSKNERPLMKNQPSLEKNQSELRVSAFPPPQEAKLTDELKAARRETERPVVFGQGKLADRSFSEHQDAALFNNLELKDMFAQGKDTAEQYEIMNRNRKKTNIVSRPEASTVDNMKQEFYKSSLRMRDTQLEKERRLEEHINKFKDAATQQKSIDPQQAQRSTLPKQLKESFAPVDSLNFFTEVDSAPEMQLNPGARILSPARLTSRPDSKEPAEQRPSAPSRLLPKYNIFGE